MHMIHVCMYIYIYIYLYLRISTMQARCPLKFSRVTVKQPLWVLPISDRPRCVVLCRIPSVVAAWAKLQPTQSTRVNYGHRWITPDKCILMIKTDCFIQFWRPNAVWLPDDCNSVGNYDYAAQIYARSKLKLKWNETIEFRGIHLRPSTNN